MTPLQYLSKIWPNLTKEGQHYVVGGVRAADKQDKFRFKFANSIEDAVNAVLYWDEQKIDTYYCIGVINGLRRIRTKVDSVLELSFDVDIKADDNHYHSVEECVSALKAFCKLLQVPEPFILLTGGGIHCHWLLEQPISREVHTRLCKGLKDTAYRNDFKIDFATVGSSAQIMRIPGTHNYKRDVPFLIQPFHDSVLKHVRLSDLDPFERAGEAVEVAQRESLRQYEEKPGNIDLLEARCLLAQELVKDGGVSLSEPAWRGLASNASLCAGGKDWFLRHSQQYPGYDEDEAIGKINSTMDFIKDGGGPLRCVTLAQYWPGCQKCPYLNDANVGNPYRLSIAPESDTAPAEESGTEVLDDGAISVNGALITNRRVNLFASVRLEGRDENRLIVDTQDRRFQVSVRDWQDYTTMSTLLPNLADVTIVASEPKKWNEWARAQLAGMRTDKKRVIPMALGWTKDYTAFKYGEYQITKEGMEYIPVAEEIYEHVKGMKPMGYTTSTDWYKHKDLVRRGLDAQKKALEPFFQDGCEHQLIILIAACFSSIFYELLESEQGGLLFSLYGDKSGTGKTTTMRAGLSLFCPPEVLYLQNASSLTQHTEKLSIFRNYPMGIDEAYKQPDDMIKYLQNYTVGRPKERLDRNGRVLKSTGEFHCHNIRTSNRSTSSMLEGMPDVSAMLGRLVEMRFDALPTKLDLKLNKAFSEYSGFVFCAFMTQFMRDERVEEFRKRAYDTLNFLNDSGRFTPVQRFKVESMAIATVAAQMLVEYRIFDINVPRLMSFYERIINQSDTALKVRTPVSSTKEYIQAHTDLIWPSISGRPPVMRRDDERGVMIIQFTPWIEYMDKLGFNGKEVMLDLAEKGFITGTAPRPMKITPDAMAVKVDCIEFRLDDVD